MQDTPVEDPPTHEAAPNHVIVDVPSEYTSSCQLPSEPLKALAAAIFLLCSGLLCSFSQLLTNQRVPEGQPLSDLVLDNIPRLQEALMVCNIIMWVTISLAFVTILFHSCRLIIFRRVFFITGLLYSYRTITITLTSLPKTDKDLDCPKISGSLTAKSIFEHFKIMSGLYCGDYIFSGHTMSLVLAWLVVKEYGPMRLVFLRWISFTLALVGSCLLVVGRVHYTVDVVIAYWITTRVWWVYHILARHSALREDTKHSCLRNFWWSMAVIWLEKGVEGRIPEGWSVPLPDAVKKSYVGRKMGCWRKEDEDTSSGSSNSF